MSQMKPSCVLLLICVHSSMALPVLFTFLTNFSVIQTSFGLLMKLLHILLCFCRKKEGRCCRGRLWRRQSMCEMFFKRATRFSEFMYCIYSVLLKVHCKSREKHMRFSNQCISNNNLLLGKVPGNGRAPNTFPSKQIMWTFKLLTAVCKSYFALVIIGNTLAETLERGWNPGRDWE